MLLAKSEIRTIYVRHEPKIRVVRVLTLMKLTSPAVSILILLAKSAIRSSYLRQVLENRSCQLGLPRENEFATSINFGEVWAQTRQAKVGRPSWWSMVVHHPPHPAHPAATAMTVDG
jgi:hypothetical protein